MFDVRVGLPSNPGGSVIPLVLSTLLCFFHVLNLGAHMTGGVCRASFKYKSVHFPLVNSFYLYLGFDRPTHPEISFAIIQCFFKQILCT